MLHSCDAISGVSIRKSYLQQGFCIIEGSHKYYKYQESATIIQGPLLYGCDAIDDVPIGQPPLK